MSRANGQTVLMRENLRQMALVTGAARRTATSERGRARSRRSCATLKLPVGYTWEVGGQYLAQRQAFRELLQVLAIASALVFVILVVHFRAFRPAVLILGAAPLSLAGRCWRSCDRHGLNVSSAMGLVLLIGLVVKNGIVLLDYAERERERGVPAEKPSTMRARVRLRPILMTTLVHPVRPGSARAWHWRRRRTAASAGTGRHRRADALDHRHLYLIPALYAGLYGRARATA